MGSERIVCGCTYTSPGLFALGPGRFSQSGVTATALILTRIKGEHVQHVCSRDTHGSWSFAIANIEATTVAAPPTSCERLVYF